MKVILFDIDGTLMLTGKAGLHAIQVTLEELFSIDEPARITIHGQTDRGIAKQLFRAHQIDDTVENWERFHSTYTRNLEQQLPIREGTLLPGVPTLLEQLEQRNDVEMGLLTGNVERGAKLKLSHYQIDHYFAFGGFGDHHAERNDVAATAKREAEQSLQRTIEPNSIWVVGDTPNDVLCGQSIGARVLAVATGASPLDELAACQPDQAVSDLTDVDAILDLLLHDSPVK